MNDIPEKNIPTDETFGAGVGTPSSGLIVAGGGSSEQFPVLKAFQDFIEAERAQARKRVLQLSLTFAMVLIVVVAAFFAIGISMFNNMSQMQSRLLDAALRRESAPAPQPVPAAQPVVVQAPAPIAAPAAVIPESVNKKLDELGALAAQLKKDEEGKLEEMRKEMEQMRRQNEEMRKEMEQRKQEKAVPSSGTRYTSRGVGILKPASFYREQAAEKSVEQAAPPAAVQPPAPPAKAVEKVEPQKKAEPSVAPVKTVEKAEPVKAPKKPIEQSKVVPPNPPKGMYSTTVPVENPEGKKIPWTMMIPE